MFRVKLNTFQVIFSLGFLAWSSLAPLYLFYGWYLRSENIGYVEIGTLFGLSVIFTFLAQIISGFLFDRFHNYKFLLLLVFSIRSLSTFLIAYLPNSRDTYIWYILSSFSLGMFTPLTQSAIAETSGSKNTGTNLGKFRLSGSAGWVFSCIASGLIATQSLKGSFILSSIFSFLAIPFTLLLTASTTVNKSVVNPSSNQDVSENNTKQNSLVIFIFYLSVFFASIGMGAASNFLNIFILENGNTPLALSSILAIGALVEVPSMLLSGKLSDIVGPLKLLSVSEFFLGLVYVGYATVKNLGSFFVIQSIRGLFYAIFTVSGMHFSSTAGGKKRRGMSAGIYNVSNTIGLALGPYLAGLISQYSFFLFSSYSGVSGSFIFSSIISIFAAFSLWFYELLKKAQKR